MTSEQPDRPDVTKCTPKASLDLIFEAVRGAFYCLSHNHDARRARELLRRALQLIDLTEIIFPLIIIPHEPALLRLETEIASLQQRLAEAKDGSDVS